MASEVAVGFVSIVPEAKGFASKLAGQVNPGLKAAGTEGGKHFSTGMGSAVSKIGAGLALGAIGLQVKDFVQSSVAAFKQMGSSAMGLSRVMGGSVEDASRMAGALRLSGVDADKATTGLRKFSQNIVDNSDAMIALGVATTDASGKIRPTGDVLKEVADRFKGMENGAEKTALSVALFGRSGMDMIPFLNRGSEGIAALEEQTAKYGMTLSQVDADNLKKFNAAQREMSMATDGAKASLGKALMPTLTAFQEQLAQIIPPLTTALIPAFKAVGEVAGLAFQQLANNMPAVTEGVRSFAMWLSGAAQVVQRNWPQLVATFDAVGRMIERISQWTAQLWAVWMQLPPQVREFVILMAILQKAGIVSVFVGLARAIVTATGATWGLNAAMLANPATWVAVAIGSVIAAGVVLALVLRDLYGKNEEFRRSWDAAWRDAKRALDEFMVVWKRDLEPALRDALPWLGKLAVYTLQKMAFWINVTTTYVAALTSVIRDLKRAWDWLTGNNSAQFSIQSGGGGAGFASGGAVYGAGSRDSVPAMLQPGEFVLNRRMVDQFGGIPRLESVRQGEVTNVGGMTIESLVINNPVAERASESLPNTVRKLAYAGGLA